MGDYRRTVRAGRVVGDVGWRSAWDVGALASRAVAEFAGAAAELTGGSAVVDGPQVGGWFASAVRPVGWELPSPWDAVAGDYRARDGWIRLHTNAPRHRAAVLRVLGLTVAAEREAVARVVGDWRADDLEAAVVAEGGAAATMRDAAAWAAHPQGAAVASEPLIARERGSRMPGDARAWSPDPLRPLRGIRVLDLTRVLAGPVATRALAMLGATVLRVDPPGWDEPAVVPDMSLGKRAARLDATRPEGRALLAALLAGADVLVHGYRRGALDHLGLDDEARQRLRPGLVEVALTAYGWTGPWTFRRGFDSLVQMSAGIAELGMRTAGTDRPVPLPVQALDHATGWLAAAAAVTGLHDRVRDGWGSVARLSLARTACELLPAEVGSDGSARLASSDRPTLASPAPPAPLRSSRISTPWGEAELLQPPLEVAGVDLRFDVDPGPLGSAPAAWPA